MRVPAKPSELVEIYVDESSQTNHRYLVLGAIVVEHLDCPTLTKLISDARLPELPAGEAKWVKVSRTKLPAYKRIVDVIFDNPNLVHFHSLFVDTTKANHTRYNAGDRDIGFNKEIYQIATKVARMYSRSYFHLYPDYRNTIQTPSDLRLILNRGCQKRGDPRDWPFRRSQFLNSANTLPLQLADILIGALAFQLNGHSGASNASPAKTALSAHVLKKAGIADITKGTGRSGKFTVWPRQLR
jgi:hypothetical protein